MRCFNCGNSIPPDSKFCQYCGEDLSKVRFCPFCGYQLQDGMNFCPQCGRDLRSAPPMQPGEPRDTPPPQEEQAVVPAWANTAEIVPEAAPMESAEEQREAEASGKCPEGVQDSGPEQEGIVDSAPEDVSEPDAIPPAEGAPAEEGPLSADEGEPGGTAAPGIPATGRKRPKWGLPLVLLAAAVIAAGIFLWFRGAVGANGQPEPVDVSEIADFVLYLEVLDENEEVIASASGFLVNDRRTLVTNYHVVQDARHIVAKDAYGEQSVDVGSVLAYDEIADLAVLRCDSEAEVEPLVLGDSDAVRQGDKIYAVGYPLGLANTLSDGIVSSRYLDEYGSDIIQVTAAISGGNSGGPLLDADGHVIGVMCAYYVYGQNLNVAIASNTLAELLASEFHEVSLADWEDRPEVPGYWEDTGEPDAGRPEDPPGDDPEVLPEEPEPDAGADTEQPETEQPKPEPPKPEQPKTEEPKPEPPKTEKPKSGQETEPQETKPAAPAEPEPPEEGEPDAPATVTPTFGPANPNWADTMKAKVDPRFHGTWDFYEVDNFEEQNEIVIDSVVEPPTCSIDLNCGVMSYLVGGSVNNRQNVNGTDQRNTLYKYYKSPYAPYMEEETLVLVSDGLIQATYVRYNTRDGGQTISRIAYYIFIKTSDLTYDDIPYM